MQQGSPVQYGPDGPITLNSIEQIGARKKPALASRVFNSIRSILPPWVLLGLVAALVLFWVVTKIGQITQLSPMTPPPVHPHQDVR